MSSKEKNRFSMLLKHLMTVANMKNMNLAKELQYDESYISKWVTGSLLPTEKTHEKVLQEISRCIVEALDDEGWQTMLNEYQISRRSDLPRAIYDNLEAEYNYVVERRESSGSEIAPRTVYYPELTLAQFLDKMHHPVLRQVRELDVISAMDILSLDRHYQLALAQLNASENVASRNYPGVSFSMLINLDVDPKNTIYNVTFLLNLLSNLTDLNFKLYSCPRAVGKLIFAVRDAYSISGMIIDENNCMSVTTSEEIKHCNATYDRLQSMCSAERLLVRKTTMEEMIDSHVYVRSLFARNQRWMIGHLTEHFLPDDLFEELAQSYCAGNKLADINQLRQVYATCRSVLREGTMRMLFLESALEDMTVSGEIDFFNRKMYLTHEQRIRYLEYLKHLLANRDKVQVRAMPPEAMGDFRATMNPVLFLSDSLCCVRLIRSGEWNNVSIVNRAKVSDMFRQFFDEVWDAPEVMTQSDGNLLEETLDYAIAMARVHNYARGEQTPV